MVGPCDVYLIPAKVIFNWDFRKYPVSKKAAAFLTTYQYQPFIDLKVFQVIYMIYLFTNAFLVQLLNSTIYEHVEEMAALQSLRIQLNFIRAYLFTCTTSAAASPSNIAKEVTKSAEDESTAADAANVMWGERLQNLMWPKEYLYEHIHRYAIADLHLIGGGVGAGTLASQMQKAVEFGRAHILACILCSQKGFICELCKSSAVLYPFDIETTYQVSCIFLFFSSYRNLIN